MDSYLHTVDSDWYRQRVSGALICVLAAFLIILVRLYYLQVVEGPEFRRQSQNNCVRLQGIPPPRGLIFDRDGVLLVENRPCFNISIVPREAKNPKGVVNKLAELLDITPEPLFARLAEVRGVRSFKPVLLRRDVSRDVVAIIEAYKLDLPGIVITVEPSRHYLEGKRASHLVGYLGEISGEELKSGCFPDNRIRDFIGRFGVEKAYEPYFHGRRGEQQIEVNALGQLTRVLKTEEATPGNNIYLTLDIRLQRKAEALLSGKVGAAVAMDPSNGHILAMASSPAFDPNVFVEGMTYESWNDLSSNRFRPMENKAIQGQYPPASTYKIVTAIAGLEEGVITEHTRVFCPGYYRYGDRTFRCWKRGGHGFMKITDALVESCDVFFYQVGEKLGVDRLAGYAKACGLGLPTGVDLDKEAKGLVPTSWWKLGRMGVPWQGGETLSVAIGQGFNLVTPIQMLSLISAVANGGIRYKPLVVRRIESSDGSLVKKEVPVPSGRLSVSDKTLEIVKRSLMDAVNKPRGTGWIARIAGIDVAGKTGTAQVVGMEEDNKENPVESEHLHLRDHAWFIAFAPAEQPRVAVAVLIEHGGHGSTAAGPIAREMIKTYLKVN
ncbi:MAG: penicillin-binding protein 2 [Deltaproteobacteria bacterium]|nr:penicillin-binding protein 2 [Deltaproteobacteria bacterium]MBW1793338.1 penicillin-binding protein 2 [Deltaproteobacteria bacterium]MBW2329930.1 penicillin-binding protein 2 [Deltaproteobacteria bacterium]